MITFGSHCRPFRGEFFVIQRAAVRSWREAAPGCQVVLMGGPDLYGFVQVGETAEGIARVDDIFRQTEALARFPWVCVISSDIVLRSEMGPMLRQLAGFERPLVVGRRRDIAMGQPWSEAVLHTPAGLDYFLYRKGTLGQIPAFAVGRTAYDNWLVWAAQELWGMTVVDATETMRAYHLEHSYPEHGDREAMLASQARRNNVRLARATGCMEWRNVRHADVVLAEAPV